MMTKINAEPSRESVIAAMQAAWHDHQHARDQTWKTLQGIFVLAAGLVTVELQFNSLAATSFAAVLVIAGGIFGLLVTGHHREYERRKFTHIMRCEHVLGLRTVDESHPRLLSTDDNAVLHWKEKPEQVPVAIRWSDIARPSAQTTPIFIMRIHAVMILFALLFWVFSLLH
jgi:hypothetical protein